MARISIISPAYNEEASIPKLLIALDQLVERNPNEDFQVVIVENGSTDGSLDLLRSAVEERQWLRVLRLTRNFDIEGAMLAGLDSINGDCCIFLNADLEDPPEMVDAFIREWHRGALHVVGLVQSRPSYSRTRRFLTRIFYSLASRVTGGVIARDISDFRLLDRLLYMELRKMREYNRLNRGLIGYVGGPVLSLPYQRKPRAGGASTFKVWGAIKWGLRQMMGFTVAPLRVITLLGTACCLVSIFGIGFYSLRAVTIGVPFPGFGSLVVVILAIGGLQFIALGVIAEYLAVSFLEIKQRPRYIIQESFTSQPMK